MTISGTLSSALSGLTAATRAAELVSSNIANATTPGYGRRELLAMARTVGSNGQGVQVIGVSRAVNLPLLGDRRLAQSAAGDADARAAFYQRLETTLGTPDQAFSVNGRVAAFDAALTEAISHPESEPRLASVLGTARALARQITAASGDVQAARTAADHGIAGQVTTLNTALDRAANLNLQIRKSSGLGQDVSALLDLRQQVVDSIARIIPLREVQEDGGAISLYTPSGAVLLNGPPSVFGFAATSAIAPGMALGAGLSGLTLNGSPIATAGDRSMIRDGALAANFAIRDELAVTAQAQLDAVARDLVERFADPGLDPTRAVGDSGLFTDAGTAFDPVNETGLAQRLRLNAAVDPAQGGALWRLRDGLAATTPGATGNSALLTDLRAALTQQRQPVSGGFMAGTRSLSELAGDLLSFAASSRLSAQGEATYSRTRLDTFTTLEAEGGIDTDQEMQSLLQIEQAYAANARVFKTVDAMIQILMEI